MKNIGVFAVIINNEKILLEKRNYGNHGWTLPGGAVENAESLEEAVRREVKEETNQDIQINNYVLTSYDKKGYSVAIVYNCSVVNDNEIVFPERELTEVKWCELKKLPEELTCRQKKWIESAINNNIGVFEI